MRKISDFYHLNAWKESHKLVLMVYKLTEEFPKEERYGLTSQIRRAAVSITANIAEGFGRYHFADKVRFYLQARGSVKEVQSFIYLAKDLDYFEDSITKKLWKQSKRSEQLLNGLINSTKKQKK